MPRSLRPLPDESLAGYLLNLAHRLRLSPGEVACRVGLFTHQDYTSLNLQFAVTMPPERQEAFATSTGLTVQAVVDLTQAKYAGRWYDVGDPARTAKSHYGTLWATPSWTHYCPLCLADAHDDNPDRRLWQLQWTTPWAVACAHHKVLLVGACPGEDTHAVLTRDPQQHSLIRAPRHLVVHPTACRFPIPRRPEHPRDRVPLCQQRLDTAVAEAAPPDVLALQRRFDRIMQGEDVSLTTLGLPVSTIQYLRDLRLMAVLLQVANDPTVLTDLPPSYLDKAAHYLDDRRDFRDGAPKHHRTWAYPPAEPHVHASLLTTASALLDRADSTEEITRLADRALVNERARWTKLRWHGRPSDRLAPLLTSERTGIISTPNLRRAAGGQQYTLTTDNIPAFLDPATVEHDFADFATTKDLRALRRTIPLGLARLVGDCTATDAALALGYTSSIARNTIWRVSGDLGRENARLLQDRIAEYASELDQREHINWGHRRRYFTPDWRVPDDHWEFLKRLVTRNRITNKHSVLESRRRAYSVWIWSIVTSGDPAAAPMAEPPAERPDAPGRGAIQVLWKMTGRGHLTEPLHKQIVEDIAKSITAVVDATPLTDPGPVDDSDLAHQPPAPVKA